MLGSECARWGRQVMFVLVVLSLTLCSIAFIYLLVVGNRNNGNLAAIHKQSYDEIVKARPRPRPAPDRRTNFVLFEPFSS